VSRTVAEVAAAAPPELRAEDVLVWAEMAPNPDKAIDGLHRLEATGAAGVVESFTLRLLIDAMARRTDRAIVNDVLEKLTGDDRDTLRAIDVLANAGVLRLWSEAVAAVHVLRGGAT
jgi:hypothetical protein